MANGCANVYGINANGFHGFYFESISLKATHTLQCIVCCVVMCSARTHTVGGKYLAQNVILHKEKVVNNERGISLFHATSRTFSAELLNYQYSFVYLSPIKNHLQSTLYMRHVEKVIVRSFPRNNFLAIPSYIHIHFVN